MRSSRAGLLAFLASCSFVAVKGPQSTSKDVTCTDSDVIPALDAVAGALLISGAIGGEIADHLSAHPIDHYELIIGLPALVAGIVYVVAASHGTDKVSACQRVRHGDEPRDCDGCPAPVP